MVIYIVFQSGGFFTNIFSEHDEIDNGLEINRKILPSDNLSDELISPITTYDNT
jgi:hypothetical protein